MGVIKWILAVAEKNRDILLDLVRIYLGVGLFAKGIFFSTGTRSGLSHSG